MARNNEFTPVKNSSKGIASSKVLRIFLVFVLTVTMFPAASIEAFAQGASSGTGQTELVESGGDSSAASSQSQGAGSSGGTAEEKTAEEGSQSAEEVPAPSAAAATLASTGDEQAASLAESNSPTLSLNGADTAIQSKEVSTGSAAIDYGQTMSFSVSPAPEATVTYYSLIANSSTKPHPEFGSWTVQGQGNMCLLEPGTYYLGFKDDRTGDTYNQGQYGVTVNKATFSAPTNAHWELNSAGTKKSVATWTAPTTTTKGTELTAFDPDVTVGTYSVTLYSVDSQGAKTLVSTTTVAGTETTCDFSDAITNAAGMYVFDVVANPDSGQTSRFNASAAQESSRLHVACVTVEAGSGVSGVTPASPFTLYEGVNSQAITATVAAGFTFDSWAASTEGALSFDSTTSASTTVSMPEGCTSTDMHITITARGYDTTPPAISAFSAAAGADAHSKLTATARDNESGLASYAFSTATDAASVPADAWQTVPDGPKVATDFTATYDLAANGTYYFYAKDASGNTTRSDALNVTKVIYNNYYAGGAAQSYAQYLIGAQTLTLASTQRSGFTFGGWFENAAFSGDPVTQLSTEASDAPSDKNVYAKWTEQTLEFTVQPQGLSRAYNTESATLTAALKDTTQGTIAWQWYKQVGTQAPEPIEGKTGSGFSTSMTVKDVVDSANYYAVATVSNAGEESQTATSSTATVSITAPTLTLTVDGKQCVYGDAAPTYTYSIDGYVGTETQSAAHVVIGTVTCAYSKGDAVNSYPINASGFSAPNYVFNYVNATLTVGPKNVTDDQGVTVALSQENFTYTGQAIVPDITVKQGDTTLVSGTDYDATVTDNVNAGTAHVSIVFKGNYTGSKAATFTILPRQDILTLTMEGWTYGETEKSPVLSGNTSTSVPVYHYRVKGQMIELSAKPVDAGTYEVWVTVAADANHYESTTQPVEFTVGTRALTITAGSNTWDYDGAAHSENTYSITSGSFAGSDGFLSVTVSGTITDAGTVSNTISSYEFTAATKASNYVVTRAAGTLTVNKVTLPTPTQVVWGSTPGLATWVPLSISPATATYDVTLYRIDGSTKTSVGFAQNVSDASFDFASTIKANCTTQGAASGYCFTVLAKTASGNYNAATVSDYSDSLYTVHVQVRKSAGGVASVGIIQSGATVTDCYMLSGESASISATLDTGAGYYVPFWRANTGNPVSFANASALNTTVTVDALNAAQTETTVITAYGYDPPPVIGTFTAENYTASGSEYLQKAIFTLKATDTKALAAYAFTTKTQSALDENDWTACSGKSLDMTKIVTSAGTYHLYVKDSAGSITASDPVTVYSVSFNKGIESATGAMNSVLSVQNTSPALPAVQFSAVGKNFRNWVDAAGKTYADQAAFSENENTTLTAQWATQQFDVTVNYYNMDTAGAYPAAASPSFTKTYKCDYGTVITSDAEQIQIAQTGFSLDTSEGRIESVTVDAAGKSLNVYYSRNQYRVTYQYTNQITLEIVDFHTDTYYYDATIAEYQKPSFDPDNEAFIGWVWGDSAAPAKMPASDVLVTGEIIPLTTHYNVVYYLQDINGQTLAQTFTAGSTSATRPAQVEAKHGDEVTVSVATYPYYGYTGYKLAYVTSHTGTAPAGQPGSSTYYLDESQRADHQTATGTVSGATGQTLTITYYFSRDVNTLQLKIVDADNMVKYTHDWQIPYGASLGSTTSEVTETYAKYYESDTTPGKWEPDTGHVVTNAKDAAWSSGSVPLTMPYGSTTTITRQDIAAPDPYVTVEVYLEDATEGSFSRAVTTSYTRRGTESGSDFWYGDTVTIGNSTTDTVNYECSAFKDMVPYFSAKDSSGVYHDTYEFDSSNPGNVLSDEVIYGEDMPVLKVYFKRIDTTITYKYYYNDNSGSGNVLFYTATKTRRWGSETANVEQKALFDTTVNFVESVDSQESKGKTIGGVAAEQYDFRNNNYMVSYQAQYYLSGIENGQWSTKTLNSLSELDTTYTTMSGQPINSAGKYVSSTSSIGSGTVSIYYRATETPTLTYLNVVEQSYLSKETDTAKKTKHNFVVEADNGTDYYVRYIDTAYLYSDTTYTPNSVPQYPGSGILKGTWTCGSTIKSELASTVTVGGVSYHTDGTYIYVTNEQETDKPNLYTGNLASSTYFPSDKSPQNPGYAQATNYVSDYKATYGDKESSDYDSKAKFAYVYSGRYSYVPVGGGEISISYIYHSTQTLYHVIDGTRCSGHLFQEGSYATGSELYCDEEGVYNPPAGMTTYWYADAECSQHITESTRIKMDSDKIVNGKYVNASYSGFDYAHYYLGCGVTLSGSSSKTHYLSYADLSDSAVAPYITSTSTTQDIEYADGGGINQPVTITTTKYYYRNPENDISYLVLAQRTHPQLGLSEVSIEWASADDTPVQFKLSDFDEAGYYIYLANANTKTADYCLDTACDLHAYYQANGYNFTYDPANVENVDSSSTKSCSWGSKVTFDEPTRYGYTFTGWTWQKKVSGQWTEWTTEEGAPTGDSGYFFMPNYEVKATANWQGSSYDQEFVHYYQTISGVYATDTYSSMQKGGTAGSFTLDGTTKTGMLYYDASCALIGASYADSGKTWYYAGSSTTLHSYDIIAMDETISLTSESTEQVATYEEPIVNFSFNSALVQTSTSADKKSGSDEFTAKPGITVSYYYDRASFMLDLDTRASDGGETGLVLTGEGSYKLGQLATVRANVAAGYTFDGWYLADSSWQIVQKIGTDNPASVPITRGYKVLAMSIPDAVDAPTTVSIAGKQSYSYGYPESSNNTLTATVAFADQDCPSYVQSYQWYEVEGTSATEITGANSSTYTFPTGKGVGSYTYRCVATVINGNNGRTATYSTEDYTVTVSSADMDVTSVGYDGVYDRNDHQIAVNVTEPKMQTVYDVYYSETELTAENYSTAGSATCPSYKNVKKNASGEIESYTTYYYIHCTDGNYNDCAGSSTVRIAPATLTAAADATKTYTRVYNAVATLTDAEIATLKSDGYYSLSGVVSGDEAEALLSFSALYDSEHVVDATHVALTSLSIVNSSGNPNDNYTISTTQVNVPATITAYSVAVQWDATDSWEYDGASHVPTASIVNASQLPDQGITLEIAGQAANAGSHTATATLVFPDGSHAYPTDYAVDSSTLTKDFTITKKAITVDPVDATFTYDATSHNLSAVNLASGTLLEGHTLSPTFEGGYTAANTYTVDESRYAVRIVDSSNVDYADNYEVTKQSGTLTINKATYDMSGVTFANDTVSYNAQARSLAITGTLPSGVTVAYEYSQDCQAVEPANVKNVGAYTVTAKFTGDPLNYEAIADKTATLTITPVSVTVQASDTPTVSKVYDGTTAGTSCVDTGDYVVNGLVGGDTATLSSFAATYNAADVSSASWVTMTDLVLDNANYTLTTTSFEITASITAKEITVAAAQGASITKSYDGTTSATVATTDYAFDGIVGSDAVALTYTAAYNSPNVTEADKVRMSSLSIDNANYMLTITSFDIPGSITPIDYDMTGIGFADGSFVYDGTTHSLAITGTLPTGVTVSYANNSLKDIGSQKVTASFTGDSNHNAIASKTVTLTVTQRAITVTAKDKSITYGDAAPTYDVSYTNLVSGETITIPNLSVTCTEYDVSAAATRGAGLYKIEATGDTSVGNYSITYANGTLTVGKKAITVTAEDKSKTYGEANPVFTCQYSGFVYEETSSVITGTPTLSTTATDESVAGTYTISVDVSGLSADNYSFTAAVGTLTIDKKSGAYATGIGVAGKTYDNSTSVAADHIVYSEIVWDSSISQADMDYVNTLDNRGLSVTASYDDKDVGTNKNVSLTIALGEYLAARYTLNSTKVQKNTASSIAARDLTITAKSYEILYGAAAPTYEVTYSGFAPNEDQAVLSGSIDYSCSYTSGSPVGEYPIDIQSSTIANSNYAITKVNGKVDVKLAKLDTPTVTWSYDPATSTDIEKNGLVTWTAVDPIVGVGVKNYSVVLKKDGVVVSGSENTVLPTSTLECNYTTLIRQTGGGSYTVEVTANSANTGNVANSDAGASAARRAAALSVSADSTGSTAGYSAGYVGSAADPSSTTYTGINGETVNVKVVLVNKTGYSIDASGITDANGNIQVQSSSASRSDENFIVPVKLNLANSGYVATVVKAKLGINQADFTFNGLTLQNNGPEYGYSEAQAPISTASATKKWATGDYYKDSESMFTFTYQWYLKRSASQGWEAISTDNPWTFPTGMNVNKNYYAYCDITLTRSDNGTTKTISTLNEEGGILTIAINPAKYSVLTALSDWTYGSTRNDPYLHHWSPTDAETTEGITWEYCLEGTTDWVAESDFSFGAGTHQVRALVAEHGNYAEIYSNQQNFTIAKAKLNAPTNVSVDAITGTLTWNAVSGISENAGVDSKSEAHAASYTVEVLRDGTVVGTIANAVSPLDVSAYFDTPGNIYFNVKAESSNESNCDDSAFAPSNAIVIGGTIAASGGFTKTYDGVANVLRIAASTGCSTLTSYQWYKDGNVISGATSATYSVTNVADTAKYSCVAEENGTTVYTNIQQITINKRAITLTSATASKTYDGSALTNSTVTDTLDESSPVEDGFVTGEGATYDVTGSRLDAGSSANVFTYTLNTGTDANNYTITKTEGTLTITAIETKITITANSASKTYDGEALTDSGYTYTDNVLLTGDVLAAVVEGTQTDAGSTANTVKSYQVKRGDTVITSNYTFGTSVDGTLTVNKRAITLTSATASKTYDGEPLTDHTVTDALTSDSSKAGFVGNEGATYDVTGTVTNVSEGSVANAFTYTLKSNTKADNYDITKSEGTLSITAVTEAVTVTILENSASKTYNGSEQSVDGYSVKSISSNLYKEADFSFTGDTSHKIAKGTHVGTYQMGLVPADFTNQSANFTNVSFAIEDGVLEVTKRSVTLASADDSKKYDGTALTNGTVTVTGDGFVSGEGVTYSNWASIVDADSKDNTFDYSFNSGTQSGDYDITRAYGTLEVTKRSVTLTSATASKTYDGTALTKNEQTDVAVTGDGFASGEGATYSITGSQLDKGTSDNTFTYTLNSGTKAGNYDISTVAGKLTVNAVTTPIVVTADSSTKLYDGTALTDNGYTYTTGVLLTGETIKAEVSGSQTDAGKSDNTVTSHKVMRGTTDITANYSGVTYAKGSLEVTKRSVTLTSATASKTYDGTALTKNEQTDVAVTGDGFASGEGATYSITGSQLDKGTSDNTFTYTLNDGTSEDNYDISTVAGKLTVNAVTTPIVVTADSSTKLYDGTALTDNGYTYTTGVLLTGETIKAEVSGSQTDAGKSDNTVTSHKVMRGTTDITANYSGVTYAKGSLEVTKRSVTLTSATASKTYDGTALTKNEQTDVAVTGDGFASGEGATYTITGSQLDKGTSDNTFTYALNSGTKAGNYDISTVAGKLTVTSNPNAITITANSKSKVYDGTALTDSGFTYTENVLASGDELTAVVEGTRTDYGSATNTVTSYKVKRGTTDVTGNYTFNPSVTGTLEVAKRAITLTSATASKTYDGTALTKNEQTDVVDTLDGADPALKGFVDGEGATYSISGSQTKVGASNNTFTYSLNEGTKADNYTITKSEGTLTVNKITSAITITADSASKVYDGTALAKGSFTYTDGVIVSGDTLTAVVEGTQTDAGSSANTVTSYKVMRGNIDMTSCYTFSASVPGTLEVAKRAITLTSASSSKTYNGQPLTSNTVTDTLDGSSPVAAGFVSGEGASYSVTGSRLDAGVSNNTFTYELNSKTKAENYIISTAEGTLTVNKIETPIDITANSKSKVYDGTALTDTGYTYTDNIIVGGDTLEVVVTGSQTDAGSSLNKITSAKVMRDTDDVTGNYTIGTKSSGTLTVDKRFVTLTSAGDSKKYDGTALSNSTVTVSGDGWAADQYATFDVDGSQQNAGTSDNTFTYSLKNGAKKANYEITQVFGKLTVSKRSVTLTSATDTKVYDGTALTNDTVTVGGDDFATGEGARYSVTGSQLLVGASSNTFTYTLNDGTSEDNYDIEKIEGTLTIEEFTVAPINVEKVSDEAASKSILKKTALSALHYVIDNGGVAPAFVTETKDGALKEAIDAHTASYTVEQKLTLIEPSSSDKELVEKALNNQLQDGQTGVVGMYFDITIYLKDKDGDVLATITKTSEELGFSVPMDSATKEKLSGSSPLTIHLHNGAAVVLPTTMSENNVLFSSGEFSTFAPCGIVAPGKDTPASSDTQKVAKTGDSTKIIVGIVVVLLIAAAVVLILAWRRCRDTPDDRYRHRK